MRRAVSARAPKFTQTAQSFSIPAPVGGLNARDPYAQIPITDCISMSGIFVSSSGIVTRKGYSNHTTGLPSSIKSFMTYRTTSGTETMFAESNQAFYNVTSSGAVGAAVQSGLSDARWQYVNFTTSSPTSYLCCFNGADSPRYWDGTTWTTITGVSTPAITGLTTSTIKAAAVHKRRMWLIQQSSLDVWYLPVDSVGGAAAKIELGGIATKGGRVVGIDTWTQDAGDGIDDYLVIVTSEGQLIAYAGTDPSSSSTWALVGVWDIPRPIGVKPLYKYGGDVLILTTTGVASARRVMSGDSSNRAMLTDKISGRYVYFASSASSNPERYWLMHFPSQSMLILNMNNSNFAMDTASGAWSELVEAEGMLSAGILGENPYYGTWSGTTTTVKKFWGSNTDNGSSISGSLAHGFSDFGQPGIIKKVGQMRTSMISTATSTIGFGVCIDYDPNSSQTLRSVPLLSGVSGMTQWVPIKGLGVAFAPVFSFTTSAQITYNGASIIAESGGIMGASQLT